MHCILFIIHVSYAYKVLSSAILLVAYKFRRCLATVPFHSHAHIVHSVLARVCALAKQTTSLYTSICAYLIKCVVYSCCLRLIIQNPILYFIIYQLRMTYMLSHTYLPVTLTCSIERSLFEPLGLKMQQNSNSNSGLHTIEKY